MNKNIGDMSESELKDFIIELTEENSRYERKNQKYKEVIDKAIEILKLCNSQCAKETIDILKGEE